MNRDVPLQRLASISIWACLAVDLRSTLYRELAGAGRGQIPPSLHRLQAWARSRSRYLWPRFYFSAAYCLRLLSQASSMAPLGPGMGGNGSPLASLASSAVTRCVRVESATPPYLPAPIHIQCETVRALLAANVCQKSFQTDV
ncbi:hypothetical protein RRG08_000497 [Elysia crispata]|uniref:Uncharacterized protein n=1 Tax=Elysia crispata TaxID=231223 RepID=A0AAE0YD69_9GAST|nr:hypothetical protein RRG08_000497 [Elysia crispata]